jgi:DNA-binding FadR family transcriptional regulator
MSERRWDTAIVGTLSTQLMNAIGRRIVAGDYKMGATLPSEFALCDEYGVSRTPLREAVKKLLAKGLIAVAPKSGTRVLPADRWNQLDPDVLRWRFDSGADGTLIDQLYELRGAFEPEACRLAALNGSETEHAEISRHFERMRALHHDPHGVVEADLAFHMAIVAATRNLFLISVSQSIRMALDFWFSLSADKQFFPESELDRHRLIRDAIVARRGGAAAAAMRRLLLESRRSLDEALAATRLAAEPAQGSRRGRATDKRQVKAL